jgi:hypothetical protein
LGWVKDDAEYLAERIEAYAARDAAGPPALPAAIAAEPTS